MADKLNEYLKENPELEVYLEDGKVKWSSFGIDIESEKLNPDFISETDLFIDLTTLL